MGRMGSLDSWRHTRGEASEPLQDEAVGIHIDEL